MDTDRLRYFCTIAKTESIQQAAQMLRLSPAALSKSVKLLESEIGAKLIAPSGRGIIITDEGRKFAAQAEELLTEFNRLQNSVRSDLSKRKPLRLGSFEVFTTHFLGPLMKNHLSDYDLILHELLPGRLEQAIWDRHVDLGLTYLPIPRAGLDFMKASQIEMGVFSRQGAFENTAFEEIPFAVPVTPLEGTPSKVEGLDGWPDHLIQRQNRYRVAMMESALELCRQGLAAAFLPSFVVDLHNAKVRDEFKLYPVGISAQIPARFLHQPIFIVKRKSDPETPVSRKLAKALRLLCES